MRFDDRLKTLLAQSPDGVEAKATLWAQLVDLAAQQGDGMTSFGMIADSANALRDSVPIDRRAQIARGVARMGPKAAVLALLARDVPPVAAPVLLSAQLDDGQWQDIIPSLPPASRALVRERRDLPEGARAMLRSYGASDFALPGLVEATVASEPSESSTPGPVPIRELVARIEAFQRQRATHPLSPLPESEDRNAGVSRFRFEVSREGLIEWVEGVTRGALIGLSVADMAAAGSAGVDGQAAGAFRQRAAIVEARMVVAGDSDAGGDWLISADPLFNADDGRFTGYRGVARRPGVGAAAASDEAGLSADGMRQLVHELRTPLNAMRGFADMIAHQMLGPVAVAYREKAASISVDAQTLAALLDDLDLVARIDRGAYVPEPGQSNLEHSVRAAIDAIADTVTARGVHVRVSSAPGFADVAAAAPTCRQLVERLLAVVVGAGARDELIAVRIEPGDTHHRLKVSKPTAMVQDAGESGAAAFAIKVVDRLSRAAGGMLLQEAGGFTLTLPSAPAIALSVRESIEIP